ncbi:D-allose transporter substrate-binding protein [Citrobacter portucalensis]|uniref:D-allose transporter substrate-binding protein n=1 Tax=Citrobacter portucalensis TaxID=1639133 RepID=UPI00226B02A3|nr:D-allose transporter substrate-binding protein [Citrobacter portucalensis]MCX9024039.1 D-allose transporter substrate-binding protein [Citrobacter portucalensis]MCX9058660.1 D-allose transporter substrate-binding protein [Citrobacter portucalensis]MCX9063725.1 D-allose transporter substrate-binding protein [Citrobacter portucalensis]
MKLRNVAFSCVLLSLMSQSAMAADVAVILKSLSDPFFLSIKQGIEDEAQKRGVAVDFFAPTSDADPQGQLRLLEDAVNKNYKGIALAPTSPVSLVRAIAKANKKGIYVVNIDEKVDIPQLRSVGGSIVGYTGTDNVLLGEKAGKYIVNQLGQEGGKVAIIEGKPGYFASETRKRGVTTGLNSSSAITIASSQPGDWDRVKAMDVTANILQRYPDVRAIYSANDVMSLGVVQAVKNAGKIGKVMVVGTDASPEARDSIKRGELTASIAQNPQAIGAAGLDMLLDAIANKAPMDPAAEPKFMPVDTYIVTKNGRVDE